ncbi:hypothetical protein OG413_08425 [Streptomyces sp. NBC_01433]|uniref:hypothetical protein n=1 Tax=Streptomyces sp. NBC_01433 TaxID=2903864 RepID=UPI00224DD7C9|nr:hypothetical protein [Streptomyces sp. NBC_01433]MCX4675348.1 hypothetical protein [Streptomyces sp. NBC_01433]
MPNTPLGGLGHVPVAVYSCASSASAVREAERRARHYADACHWLVAGVWTDRDPSVPLGSRLGWQAMTGALSSGLVRGVVVAAISHVALDAAQFAALGVLVRDRGGFLVEATTGPPQRTPGQPGYRPTLFEGAARRFSYGHLAPEAS